jgi:hypothetical protein
MKNTNETFEFVLCSDFVHGYEAGPPAKHRYTCGRVSDYDFTEADLVKSGFGGEQIDSNHRLM